MAIETTGKTGAPDQYIVLIQDVTIVAGQTFREGDVMVISTVNARRPGGHVDNVYGLCPLWFDYIDAETAQRLMNEKKRRESAAVETEEFDPLAEFSL